MPDLVSFNLLHHQVKRLVDNKIVTNTGHAFDRVALRILLKLNDEEIEDALTDGSDDGGIDAIYIQNKTIHFCSFKYTYDYSNISDNFPGKEIEQISNTITKFITGAIKRDSYNLAVWEKYNEFKELLEEGTIEIKVHLASNKAKPVALARRKIEDDMEKYRIVEIKYYDLDDLLTLILNEKEKRATGELTLLSDQHFEKSNGQVKTIIGIVSASDFISLLQSKDNNKLIDECLFNENVRVYKAKHNVNKAIKESALSDENYLFFYLNNGITILCEKAQYIPYSKNQRISLQNFQIVNGGQTSHSLFEAYKHSPEKVGRIELLVRICVADKSDPIGTRISESTNHQIPIGTRDLHSNDSIQKKLELEFEQLGYFYERKPEQHSDQPYTKVLNNELLAQLYLAYELDSPSEARNNKAIIFNDWYDLIFNDSISANYLIDIYNAYHPLLKIKKEIQNKKRNKELTNEKEAYISRALFHILNGTKVILKQEYKQLTDQVSVAEATEKSIKYIGEVVENEMQKRGDIYTHDKFFKEIPTNSIIKNYILSKYSTGT